MIACKHFVKGSLHSQSYMYNIRNFLAWICYQRFSSQLHHPLNKFGNMNISRLFKDKDFPLKPRVQYENVFYNFHNDPYRDLLMNNINFTSQKDGSCRNPTSAILSYINLLQPIAHRNSFLLHQGLLLKSSILKE